MKIVKARDIMRRDVASVGPQLSAADLAEFFNEEGVHGAPEGPSRVGAEDEQHRPSAQR